MIANLSVLHRQTTTEFCIRCEDDKYAVEEMILILAFLDREKRISAIMKRMVEELFSSQNRKSLRLRVKVGVLLDMSNTLHCMPNRRHVSFINFWGKFAPCLAYLDHVFYYCYYIRLFCYLVKSFYLVHVFY